MGLFSNLFKKREEPVTTFVDPDLGVVRWSEDDNAWLGEYENRSFGLGDEGQSTPTSELIDYARSVLSDLEWLDGSLADVKRELMEKLPASCHEEINSLAWGSIHFFRRDGIRRIFAELDGGQNDRAWRIEFRDRTCEGIGFDD